MWFYNFFKLNAKQVYWKVKLDAASSLMTTFYTPFNRYKFLRMSFGLRMSQEIFQRKIGQTHKNCRGTVGIADDVQVFGNEKNHMIVICMRQWGTLENQALSLILINVLLRQNVVVFFW